MNRVQEAIDKLKSVTWVKIPYLSAIEQYLQTGDPAALKRITPFGQQGSWWGSRLADALRPVEKWEDVDRRIIHVLHAAEMDEFIWQWMNGQLDQEKPSEDVHGAVWRELEAAGEKPSAIAAQTLNSIRWLVSDDRPTSAGRFLLSLSQKDLRAAMKQAAPARASYLQPGFGPLTDLLTLAAPERIEPIVDELLLPAGAPTLSVSVVKPLLDRTGDKYLSHILAAFERDKDTWHKFHVGQLLYQYDQKRFRELGLNAARASLKGEGMRNNHGPVGVWMLEEFGAEVLADLVEYFSSAGRNAHWGNEILDAAVQKLGQGALPVLLSAMDGTHDAAAILNDSKLDTYARASRFQQQIELRQRALQQAAQRMYRDLRGTSVNAMTFKGRAERQGWYRGSVCDGGGITSYHKTFPASLADVFLGLEDFYIGIDMYSSIELGDVCFVKHGTVKVGSYTYDEPGNDDDPRIIPLGNVPPIVFSEVMSDIQKIAGKTDGDAAGEAEA